MKEVFYNRKAAALYAEKWAFGRNPRYLDFENLGGDCTNFVSQCIYAGAKVMNFTPVFGWYYNSSYDRTASWTGVSFLYDFLTKNSGVGPYAEETDIYGVTTGDVIQLGDVSGNFYHSLFVTESFYGNVYVATHTANSYMRDLASFFFERARFLHIKGVRAY